MSLPLQNLDDITFEELVKEAKSLIPVYTSEWTNHNPSDPGITLVELFAWLCEMIIYRIDQIPEKNYLRFLNLLGIQLAEGEELASGIRRGVQQLSECTRAVTVEDYEMLAYRALMEKPDIKENFPDISARTICLANRDMENKKSEDTEQFGHVSVILIVSTQNQSDLMKETYNIKQYVKQYLSERKVLTNRVHVVDPDYQDIKINMLVAARDKKLADTIRSVIEEHIDPIQGGEGKKGWPLGRNLYKSDLYYLVERIPGIDHVKQIELEAPALKPHQLIKLKELNIEVEA
ncbi:hypothetical protein [Ruminiclostridium cellobioparum]|uniref:Baseplate protein J-like domain-containing protein n=1 Tax=Ruminiclostridium cellobioparum subsp. termitidis CT1112 TaxID=1195236 RepID=S0FKD6_RUMCE|nr:hypothetical protein [Ruminiclostridium cellobioparum]EMS70781.1 hypothetical protein CTER_3469 [Ruminiclostridium cellobioparum subsp. termitidis CT1112]